MKLRAMKKVAFWLGITAALLVIVVVAIVVKAVYFPSYRNYSTEYVEATYCIENFESDPMMTRDTQIRVTKTKPEKDGGAIVVEPVSGGEWYYVFDNLAEQVAKVEMSALQNKQIIFTVTLKNGTRSGFSLYSYDWNKGCNVIGTDITFKVL